MVRVLAGRDVGYLRRPLDLVFGAPSHIAILRAVAQRAQGATGAEIARAAGTTNQAALDSLARLEGMGLVRRLPMGRGYIFHLNAEHGLVRHGLRQLLSEEAAFRERLLARLKGAFEKEVLSAVIYGSTGRGSERPPSDLDVCLIVRSEKGKERVLKRSSEISGPLRQEFGVRISPIVFRAEEFSRGLKRGTELMTNIQADGERFAGRPLEMISRA
jgi:predicted nucleotidyltransferase